jgi:hypothetical protein
MVNKCKIRNWKERVNNRANGERSIKEGRVTFGL